MDAAFPLSDHADYNDLMRYIDLVQPKRVFTLHGFASEFARDLRERGIEAWALSAENQREWKLPRHAIEAAGGSRIQNDAAETAVTSDSEFLHFSQVGESIAAP